MSEKALEIQSDETDDKPGAVRKSTGVFSSAASLIIPVADPTLKKLLEYSNINDPAVPQPEQQ